MTAIVAVPAGVLGIVAIARYFPTIGDPETAVLVSATSREGGEAGVVTFSTCEGRDKGAGVARVASRQTAANAEVVGATSDLDRIREVDRLTNGRDPQQGLALITRLLEQFPPKHREGRSLRLALIDRLALIRGTGSAECLLGLVEPASAPREEKLVALKILLGRKDFLDLHVRQRIARLGEFERDADAQALEQSIVGK